MPILKTCKEAGCNNEVANFPNSTIKRKYCLEHAIKASLSIAKKQVKKEWVKEKKERKDKLKTLGQLEAEAKTMFQKWVRMRDEKEPCISCGSTKAKRYDGGHWWKAEIYSGLIFHEDNCHKQCSRPCNMDLAGDPSNYRIGLVKRIGLERVIWLEENKDRLRDYKFTRQELIDIKNTYKNKIKDLLEC